MSELFALSPGIMSTPWSPPLSADSRLSRRKWLLGRSGPWQRKQLPASNGLMSREKSIGFPDGAGNFEISGAPANVGSEKKSMRVNVVRKTATSVEESWVDV